MDDGIDPAEGAGGIREGKAYPRLSLPDLKVANTSICHRDRERVKRSFEARKEPSLET